MSTTVSTLPPPEDPLTQLQSDVLFFLLGNPETALVPFSPFVEEDIQALADQSLAAWKVRQPGMIGVACMVLMPKARVKDPNVPGPQFLMEIIIRTFEDRRINNTGLTAEAVAIANFKWLDALLIEDLTETYGDEGDDAVKPNYRFPGFRVYDTTIKGALPQSYRGRTQVPDITDDNAGNVTLACPDKGATMYYTVGGSMPTPGAPPDGNSATQIYNAPFAVASGQLVRALAWNPVFLPSHVAKGRVTF